MIENSGWPIFYRLTHWGKTLIFGTKIQLWIFKPKTIKINLGHPQISQQNWWFEQKNAIVCNRQNGIWALKKKVKIGILALDLWDFYDDGLLTNHSIIQRRKNHLLLQCKGTLKRRYKSKDTHVLWVLFFRDILEAVFGRSTIYILSIISKPIWLGVDLKYACVLFSNRKFRPFFKAHDNNNDQRTKTFISCITCIKVLKGWS